MKKPHVVVIGGGALGLSTAFDLVERGAQVTVLEADALGGGSSGRSVGVVGSQMTDPFQVRLRRFTRPRFREWEALGLAFNHIGYLRLARNEDQMSRFAQSVALQAEDGFEARLMRPDDIREMIPHLSTDGIAGGLFGPDDGFLDPYEMCTFLGDQVRARGGRVVQFCRMTACRRVPGGFELATTGETITCDAVVNAAGAWAPDVARQLGQTLEVHSERHEAMTVLLEKPLDYVMPMVMDLAEGQGTGLNFRHEKPGELITEVHKSAPGAPEDPDNYNDQCLDTTREYLAELLLERLPGLDDARLGRGWAGLYPTTADQLPYAGPVDLSEPGIVTAGGGGGYGIQLAPVIGRVAADWVLAAASETIPEAEILRPSPERNRPRAITPPEQSHAGI
ncbi:MAG: FAD-binding oxidoreductase [Pseudomonadota bacterium]|nr:FAD-binding oxidoreductase [Pseudomonadota bacterium]